MLLLNATDYLVPNGSFVIAFLFFAALFVLLVAWPLFSAVRRQQWGWVLGVVLLGPIGGVLWLTVGRKDALGSLAV